MKIPLVQIIDFNQIFAKTEKTILRFYIITF